MTSERIRCDTCGQSGAADTAGIWHPFKHPINISGSAPFNPRPEPPQPNVDQPTPVPGMFDPVLRQALVDKGILTPQDLRDAEEKIRVITNTFTLGGANGQSD